MFIIGSMSSVTYDLAKSQTNAIAKGFFTAIHYIVPNFGNFTFTNPLSEPGSAGSQSEPVFGAKCYLLGCLLGGFADSRGADLRPQGSLIREKKYRTRSHKTMAFTSSNKRTN